MPTTLMGLTYAQDAAGRITGVTSSSDSKESWTYGYDALDRLTAATNVGDATLSQTFQYDIADNSLRPGARRASGVRRCQWFAIH